MSSKSIGAIVKTLILLGIILWLISSAILYIREQQRQASWHAVLDHRENLLQAEVTAWRSKHPDIPWEPTGGQWISQTPEAVDDIGWEGLVLLRDRRVLDPDQLLRFRIAPHEPLPDPVPEWRNRVADPASDTYLIPSRYVGFDMHAWQGSRDSQGLVVVEGKTWPRRKEGQSPLDDVVAVYAGARDFFVLLRNNGDVHAFGGSNEFGQLGQGKPSPQGISGFILSDAIGVAAGSRHGLALKADGTVWMWGQDDLPKANLGADHPAQAFNPQVRRVEGLADVVKVVAGGAASFALKADGTVWAWGDPDCGMLGVARGQVSPDRVETQVVPYFEHYRSKHPTQAIDRPFRLKPAPVPGVADVVDLKASGTHVVAMKKDGTLWGWGDNHFQALGAAGAPVRKDTYECRVHGFRALNKVATPRPFRGVDQVRQIFAVGGMTAVVRGSDGGLWFIGSCRVCNGLQARLNQVKAERWGEIAAKGMWCGLVPQVGALRKAVGDLMDHRYPPVRRDRGRGAQLYSENLQGKLRFLSRSTTLYRQGFDAETRAMRQRAGHVLSPSAEAAASIWWDALDYGAHTTTMIERQTDVLGANILPEDDARVRAGCGPVETSIKQALVDIAREDQDAIASWVLPPGVDLALP